MSKNIGLKDAFRKPKGQGIWYWLKDLGWQFRYAWQRAWRGYDFTDVFDLGFNFVTKMPVLLREFKENNIALFYDIETNKQLNEEETDAVLDKLIFYFENCDEDHVYERLFGVDPYADEFLVMDSDKINSWKIAGEEAKRCWKEAMRLFAKWSGQLWY